MPATPVRVIEAGGLRPFWADLHGQSEETIGTNSARDYFSFARDLAFLDATAHQGNDFQITDDFWRELNEICEEFDDAGRFAVLPGYEWSGNTALGGDRNVFFREPFRPIRRSSSALIPEPAAPERIAPTARALYRLGKAVKSFEVPAPRGVVEPLYYAQQSARNAAGEVAPASPRATRATTSNERRTDGTRRGWTERFGIGDMAPSTS